MSLRTRLESLERHAPTEAQLVSVSWELGSPATCVIVRGVAFIREPSESDAELLVRAISALGEEEPWTVAWWV
jgi:hypothetical protein